MEFNSGFKGLKIRPIQMCSIDIVLEKNEFQ